MAINSRQVDEGVFSSNVVLSAATYGIEAIGAAGVNADTKEHDAQIARRRGAS